MPHIDLTTHVGTFFTLSKPFWIASSHLTSKESVVEAWEEIKPAALTLKTSMRNPPVEDKPHIREQLHPTLERYGKSIYCEGSKHLEFLTYERTAELLDYSSKKLSSTLLGTSVLALPTEDYAEFRQACSGARFCELNLKYTFRIPRSKSAAEYKAAVAKNFRTVLDEVKKFCDVFNDLPVFVKVSRELEWLPRTEELENLLGVLKQHGKAGLILANSEKRDLAGFVKDGKELILRNGVICGEYLFDSTIALIENLKESCEESGIPIVASGGMVTEGQILLAMRAGASAVQLCTTFDYNKVTFYEALSSALEARIYIHGLSSFTGFRDRLPNIDVALIYSPPFKYFRKFWSEEAQDRIKEDIKNSEIMDVMVLSGHKLLEEWNEILLARFRRNLGLRLFLPNLEGELYRTVQESWGIRKGSELEARQARVRETTEQVKKIWDETAPDRRKIVTAEKKEAEFEIYHHDQCPFYSCYLFDSTVYECPYPFVWTDELASPAFVFFATSAEYSRVSSELEKVRKRALQTRS